MAKAKKKKFQWLWIIIPVVIVVLFAFYSLSKNNLPQSKQSSTLETLQFGNTANGTITKEDAIVKVKTISEVADYIIRVPQAKVEVAAKKMMISI